MKYFRNMTFAKAKKSLKSFFDLLLTPIVLNCSLHALISLLLFRISNLLLTSGRHRNYSMGIASTASFGGTFLFVVHPNRIDDLVLQKSFLATGSYFLLALAVHLILIRVKNRRLQSLISLKGDRIVKDERISLILPAILILLAIAMVAVATTSLLLTAGSALIAALATLTAYHSNVHLSAHEQSIDWKWRCFAALATLLGLCALYISWINLVDLVSDGRSCKLRPTLGMLFAEAVIFFAKVAVECCKPLWIYGQGLTYSQTSSFQRCKRRALSPFR